MNRHLIEKLYNESADYCVSHAGDNPAWHWEEKFAELIILEVLDKISQVGYKSSNDIQCETTELFIDQIKRHFGVN